MRVPSGELIPDSSSDGNGIVGIIILLMVIGVINIIVEGTTTLWHQVTYTVSPSPATRNNGVVFSGQTSYTFNFDEREASFYVEKLASQYDGGHSGSLRVVLYISDVPYTGGTIYGTKLLSKRLSPLEGGYSYNDISFSDNYSEEIERERPYYLTLVLLEYSDDGEWIISYNSLGEKIIPPPKKHWWQFWK